MSPFLSQGGHVGFRTQASKGTYADPGAVAPNQGVFLRFRSGGMNGNRELLVPDAEIGAGRDIPDAALGAVSYSGTYDFYARMESLAFLLKAAMGGSAPSGAAGTGYIHTMSWGTTVPWVSIEEKVGNGFEEFRYTDAKVNTLHLEADANGYLTGTVGLVALTQTSDSATTVVGSQRIDTSPLLLGSKITVTYNSIALPAKSFSLDINNNLEDDDFRLGSLFLGDVTEKRREVMAGVSIRPEDSSYWKRAMYGSTSGTAPSTAIALKAGLVINIQSWEDIPAASGVKYDANFSFTNTIIAPHNATPSGDDVMENDLEIRSVLGAGANLGTVTVKNSYATTN